MVSDNLFRDTETRDDLIKDEKSCHLMINIKIWHRFNPLREVVYCYKNVFVSLSQSRLTSCKINSPLRKWTDIDDRKKRSWMSANFSGIDLIRVAFFDHFNTIFVNRRPKIPCTQNIFSFCKIRQMTSTSPTMAVI